jgi:subtilisin family serine protease
VNASLHPIALARHIALLAVAFAGIAEASAAAFSDVQRQALLTSGFASEALLAEIERSGWAAVLVSFEVPGVAPRLPERAYVGARDQRAIGAAQRALLASLAGDGFRVRHRYRALNALAGSIDARGLLRLFAQRKRVAVELEAGGTGQLLQSVPLVNLDSVQALLFSGEGVTLAILDSGIDTLHADLADDLVAERCFCSDLGAGCCPDGSTDQSGPGSAHDDHGHGTNVSGIVTSGGSVAPVGGAPDAGIVAVKVLDENNAFCCTGDLVAGLDYVLNDRPDVDLVNMSLGTASTYGGNCDDASIANRLLAAAIASLRDNGVATFAASGDEGSGAQMPAPACLSGVISVGAVYDADVGSVSRFGCTDGSTAADQVACWSSSNASTDLFAPGAPVTSSGLGGGTSTFYGTSQASPLVAACAAALLEANPAASPDGLEAALKTSPTQVVDPKNGLAFPRLDCAAALEAALHQPVPALGGGGSALAAALLIGVGLWQIWRRPGGY